MNYSKNTIGCKIGNRVFIHPELYKYPKLYHAVVEHEQEHSDGWRPEDLKHDLFGDGLEHVKKDMYKFMFLHPRTFLGYLPVTKIGKYWAIDLQMSIMWVLGILLAIFLVVFL